MRKSQNITKYEVNWQITRVLAKKEKDLEKKLKIVSDFFFSNLSIDNKERCLNWLEGLARGYKRTNQLAVIRIEDEIMRFADVSSLNKENVLSIEEQLNNARKIDSKLRVILWKDLFKRNEDWLSKGYVHKEQNAFMDMLHVTLGNEDLGNCSYQKLKQQRNAALTVKNSHKFFF